MKVYEILSLTPEFLKRLHNFGITPDDYKWVDLYHDFMNMKKKGEKVVYAVARLAEKYKVCERKVYKIIRKMEQDCQICTAEMSEILLNG